MAIFQAKFGSLVPPSVLFLHRSENRSLGIRSTSIFTDQMLLLLP